MRIKISIIVIILFCFIDVLFISGDDELESPIPTDERNALLALYNATNGKNWKNSQNWNGPPGTECGWYGISCKPEDQTLDINPWHVYHIDLSENNMIGNLPPELGSLKYLSHLYLLNNNLSGTLPLEFDKLDKLEDLLLSGNNFSGKLPPKIIQRFDEGKIRLLGYAGQFSPITQIELTFNPTAIICEDYHAVLKIDGSATLKTKMCRMQDQNDRATFWEIKRGFIDRYIGDFDRLARIIERYGFYEMNSKYSELITHGIFETVTVTHNDGKTVSVEDYNEAAPMNLWFIKRAIAGALFNAKWEETRKTEPQEN
jgi:hypothetical protein